MQKNWTTTTTSKQSFGQSQTITGQTSGSRCCSVFFTCSVALIVCVCGWMDVYKTTVDLLMETCWPVNVTQHSDKMRAKASVSAKEFSYLVKFDSPKSYSSVSEEVMTSTCGHKRAGLRYN